MILIGQYDSPFVRRVGIALHHYGLAYEHRPWSVWGDAEQIAAFNPLRRVPVLVLDDTTALVESAAILDALDDQAGERALLPRTGPVRRDGLRVASLATGLGDKAVTLLYEHVVRTQEHRSAKWVDRCHQQIRDTLAVLEADRQRRVTGFWLGDELSHADIAVACVLRFLGEAHPALWQTSAYPTLAAHAARCEALPAFRAVYQALDVQVS